MINSFKKLLDDVYKNTDEFIELDLSHGDIDAEDDEVLIAALNRNTSVKTLVLQFNQINEERACQYAVGLRNNMVVTTLDFSCNHIALKGTQAFARLLQSNRVLTKLDLTSNAIDSEGTKSLAEALKVNNTLKSLDLGHNNINLDGIKSLGKALKINNTLKELYLSYVNIDLAGIKEFFNDLKANTTLILLDLSHNAIGVDGAKNVAHFLKTNTTLTVLDFSINPIGLEGVNAFEEALQTNITLTALDLKNGSEIIEKYLKRNQSISYRLAPLYANRALQIVTLHYMRSVLSLLAPGLLDEHCRIIDGLVAVRSDDSERALNLLKEPVFDFRLQTLAEEDYAHALVASQALYELTRDHSPVRNERDRLLAYHYRNQPTSRLFKMAFYQFENPGENYVMGSAVPRDDKVCLLPYETFRQIGKDAYRVIADNPDEAAAFEQFLVHSLYNLEVLDALFENPTFLKQLHREYPDFVQFQCIERVLHLDNSTRPYLMPEQFYKLELKVQKSNLISLSFLGKRSAVSITPFSLQDKLREAKTIVHQAIG